MKAFLLAGLLLSSTLLICSSCQKEDESDFLPGQSCIPNTEVVKKVADAQGVVGFNAAAQRYAVYVGIPGTYDSQDVGIVCSLPADLQQEGLPVWVSGTYRKYDQSVTPTFAGQEYYYLLLTKISAR